MNIARVIGSKTVWLVLSILTMTVAFVAIDLMADQLEQYRREHEALNSVQARVPDVAREAVTVSEDRIRSLMSASANVLQARVLEIDGQLQAASGRTAVSSLSSFQLAKAAARGALPALIRSDMEIALLKQEREYILRLLKVTDFRGLVDRFNSAELERDLAFEARKAQDLKYRAAAAMVPAWERAIGPVHATAAVNALNEARETYYAAIRHHADLYRKWDALRSDLEAHPGRTGPGPYSASVDAVARQATAVLDSARAQVLDLIETSWVHKLAERGKPMLWAAVKISLASIAFWAALRALLFFVVAPWVSRRLPLCIDSAARSQAPLKRPPAGTSLRIELARQQELLVKDDYLQDSSLSAHAYTRIFLNSTFWISSMASGMWGLTCIRAGMNPVSVTVSSTSNPLDELAQLPLSLSSGLVLFPRYLVGVVQDRAAPVQIRSVWRFTPHAFLTFQFRYLVFYGDGALIVRGCRGVRVERPDAQRRIARAATVGFSAALNYCSARTETFTPYLLGGKPLFSDSFSGEGFYVYQEVPASSRSSSIGGKLMGVLDIFLKPLGI